MAFINICKISYDVAGGVRAGMPCCGEWEQTEVWVARAAESSRSLKPNDVKRQRSPKMLSKRLRSQVSVDKLPVRRTHDVIRMCELANSKTELDRRLDDALEETFPASDPISIMVCT